MSDPGWARRRVPRRDGGALIEEARAVVEAWTNAPPETRVGLPPWLEKTGDGTGIGRLVDLTLLQPEAGNDAILTLCDDAVRYGVRTVCVNGGWVADCASRLGRSRVSVAAVVGFPLGASASKAKAAEARLAVGDGATELDVVMAVGQAKSGEWRYVEDDIRRVLDVAADVPVKMVLETAALEPVEIAAACLVARAAGVVCVMTSTGFHPAGGATEGTVTLLRRAVGQDLGVKASGGIRTAPAAIRMLAAGADRLGIAGVGAMVALLGPSAPLLHALLESDTPSGY
jgi:deoxyribose-phosphate aldolase